MKNMIAIPTFWTDPQADEGDQYACYDHPASLGQQGTLPRALQSLNVLKTPDAMVVVIAVAQSQAAQEAVEAEVRSLLADIELHVPLYLFSYSHLRRLRGQLKVQKNDGKFDDLLCLDGYSNARNAALLAAQLLQAEVLIFLDDDEYLDDAGFLERATKFLGTRQDEGSVEAVAGYYRYRDGGYRLKEGTASWQAHWNPARWMNRAFEQYLEGPQRLERTPFAFGGCFVLARALLERLPFDPRIPRGEDIDYLINARLIGVPTWLDNGLSVVHDPPPRSAPHWKQLRIDARRFLYERAKLDEAAAKKAGFHPLSAAELQPYPGVVLTADLEERLLMTHRALAETYRHQGEPAAAQACLETLAMIERWQFSPQTVFAHLLDLQRRWRQLGRILSVIANHSGETQKFLERIQ